MKEIPIDQSHRTVVKFAVTESNISKVGQPNGEGRNTAEGWSRSQLAKLHSLHNDGQISQEGPDHRINFFYVHHNHTDEAPDNYDMFYRLEEEYKDRQCGYHNLYSALRSKNVSNSSTNNNHQYNNSNNNNNNFNNNENNNSDERYRNNNNNNYDNSEYIKSAGKRVRILKYTMGPKVLL